MFININLDKSFYYISLEEKVGGLFDIDATLPILIFQFFLLVFLLKVFLFNPLENIFNKRESLILKNLESIFLTLLDIYEIEEKRKRSFQLVNKKNFSTIKDLKSKFESITIYWKESYTKKNKNLIKKQITSYAKLAEGSNLLSLISKDLKLYLILRPI